MRSRFAPTVVALFCLTACADLPHDSPFDTKAPLEKQERGSVSGLVRLEGEGDHALVSVELQNPARTYSMSTRNDGAFKVTGVVPGRYTLRLSTRSFEPYEGEVSLSLGETLELEPRTLAPKRVSVQGNAWVEKFVNGQSVLVGGVLVRLTQTGGVRGVNLAAPILAARAATAATVTFNALSNADGSYQLAGVPSGIYAVMAASPGLADEDLDEVVVTGEDGNVVLGDTVLRPLTGFFDVEAGGVLNPAFTASLDVTLRLSGFNATQMALGVTSTERTCVPGPRAAYQALVNFPLLGEGSNSVCVQYFDDDHNKTEILTRSISLDTTPPVSTLFLIDAGTAATTDLAGRVTLNIVAVDMASGLSQMKLANTGAPGCSVALDAAPAEPFVSLKGWMLQAPADETVRWVCLALQDAVGNWSAPVSAPILWDTSKPAVSAWGVLVNGGDVRSASTRVALAFAVTGATEMQITDGGSFAGRPWEPFRSSLEWILPEIQGTRTVTARFRDAAGNLSEPASDEIELDTLRPTAPFISVNGAAAYVTSATVSLALGADNDTWMQLSSDGLFDGEPTEPPDSPVFFTLPGTDGTKFVYARFGDDAGNLSDVVSAFVSLDRSAPMAGAPLINGGAAYTQSPNVTLTLPVSGAYQTYLTTTGCLAGSSWSDYVPSVGLNLGASEGLRDVYVAYRDEAGNVSACRHASITLDTSFVSPGFAAAITGPELVAGRTKSLGVWVTLSGLGADAVEVALANDASFGGAAWQPVGSKKPWLLTAGDGLKIVYVRARDAAGNVSPMLTPSITLDQTGPEAPVLVVSDLDGDTFAVSQSQVELRWTPPSDANLAGYALERYVPGYDLDYGRLLNAPAGVNTFVDAVTESTGLVHHYRVRAFDNLGNDSGWSSPALAYPYAPVSQAAWLINSEGLRYLFAPERGTFSIHASRSYENLAGDAIEQDLGVDISAWENPLTPGEYGETLFVKTVNQDNTLAYQSAFATRQPQRYRLRGTYRYAAVKVDSQGRPHAATCEYPQIAIGVLSQAGWTFESPTLSGCWGFALALDQQDKTHLVYGTQWPPYTLYYATKAAGTWANNPITNATGLLDTSPALAMQADGTAHMVWEESGTLFFATRTTAGSLSIETMFPGTAPSFALDSTNAAHVAYTVNGDTMLAVRTGPSTWSTRILEAGVWGNTVALVIDSADVKHVTWAAPTLAAIHYARSPGYAIAQVGTATNCLSVSIALDGHNKPVASFFDTNNGTAYLATTNGSMWSAEAVASMQAGYPYDEVSVGLDKAGNTHLAFTDYALGAFYYFSRRIGRTDMFPASGAGALALAVDGNDAPHVLFHSLLSGGHPTYMTNAGGTWTSEDLDALVSTNLGIALRSDGTVHVVYDDNWGGKVKYGERATTGTWSVQEIASGSGAAIAVTDTSRLIVFPGAGGLRYATAASTGAFTQADIGANGVGPTLKFDPSGTAHLVYVSAGIEYRTFTAGVWSALQRIDANFSATTPSLALQGSIPHVAYFDNGAIKVAVRHDGAWNITTVARGVGGSSDAPSIAVSPSGWVAVVYEDSAQERFMLATNASGGWSVSRLGAGERYSELALGPNDSLQALYVGSPADNYYGMHYLRDFFGIMPATRVNRISAW